MNEMKNEEEIRKKAIFDSMSERRRKQIEKKGYAEWDPFQEPKYPIDIRQDRTKRTSQMLIREFFQSLNAATYSNDYGRGAFELCMGIINENEKYMGMFDFACWYQSLLKREGYDKK
ncbi:MAG: hypothetical protein RBT16_14735 [Desulfococcus multivorans]|jgi:hypothetical protein|nr:hypothetical protein [Desulfococcus multivorans]